ncbi:hypothetical protein M422DRAFT_54726 [Sphaerobolus stellatus SS14]|uniref:Ribosomal RNA-processing protein 41 n=1 Tax=Sphaerobolus stellatus (strain SS14) TaxID=990650 RepID=A0A0C9US31_SPHS4|nr:hypothetical protein M422DRAFT_54726 [Sphaerobolus stellatus SS14]
MGSRVEILNEGGYRSDGRKQFELRNFAIDLSSSSSNADGSSVVSHGLTTVMATVFGPREARMRSLTMHDRAVINVEVGIAPFSSGERRRRGRGDKRILEFAAAIKSTFEPVIQTHIYPRSQIDIFVQVIEQDGGILQAAINATTLALIDAGIPMSDYVTAITCGVQATHPLLDLSSIEESDVPHLTLAVMPKSGKVTLVTMETRLHVDRFEELVRLALKASTVLHTEMRAAIRTHTGDLVRAMGGTGVSRMAGREAAPGGEDVGDTMEE